MPKYKLDNLYKQHAALKKACSELKKYEASEDVLESVSGKKDTIRDAINSAVDINNSLKESGLLKGKGSAALNKEWTKTFLEEPDDKHKLDKWKNVQEEYEKLKNSEFSGPEGEQKEAEWKSKLLS